MRAFPLLLLALFFAVPLIEIYLLIKVGGWIGALPTVFMVVFTAVLGVLLLRQQGLATLQRVQATMARGQVPALELLEAMLLTVGGAALTDGVTDGGATNGTNNDDVVDGASNPQVIGAGVTAGAGPRRGRARPGRPADRRGGPVRLRRPR